MVEYLKHLITFPIIYQHRAGSTNPHLLSSSPLPLLSFPILITSYPRDCDLLSSLSLPILIISYLITFYTHHFLSL